MTSFFRYIGIDYSGRGEPHQRTSGIQVVEENQSGQVKRISPDGKTFSWSRKEVFLFLEKLLQSEDKPIIIGMDHNFSFPFRYFKDHELNHWDEFLSYFDTTWLTKVEAVRMSREKVPPYPNHTELRLTETYTATAKSCWNFEQKTGTVSYSTHAGIPWVHALRLSLGDRLHIWPFDGWLPPKGKHVLVEAYPALFYQRYKQDSNFPTEWPRDAQDALVIAKWLRERDSNGTLHTYFDIPTLTTEEKQLASRYEGWIVGVC